MKKVLTYALIFIVAAILVVAAISLLSKDGFLHRALFGSKEPEKDVESELFSAVTIEGFNQAADHYGLKSEKNSGYYCLLDAPVFGSLAEMFYLFDNDGIAQKIMAYTLVNDVEESEEGSAIQNISADRLKEKIATAFREIGEMYNVEVGEEFFIFEGESRLDNDSIESYERILSGDAHIEFLLKDPDMHYIKVFSESSGSGTVLFVVEKYFSGDEFREAVPNIIVK